MRLILRSMITDSKGVRLVTEAGPFASAHNKDHNTSHNTAFSALMPDQNTSKVIFRSQSKKVLRIYLENKVKNGDLRTKVRSA